jgi:plastocyanin
MMRAGRGKRAAVALVAIAATAVAVAPATQAGKSGKPKKGPTIKVVDDFYTPTAVKVKPNTRVKFKWDKTNLNPHNVVLQKAPKGVSKKECRYSKGEVPMKDCGSSPTGSIGVKFKPVFKKKGTYDFLCTIHPDVMKTKVTVKK